MRRFSSDPESGGDCLVEPISSLKVEEVYSQCGLRIYSLARRMLGNEADAEHVAQDVLLQVVRGQTAFHNESAIVTWLYRAAVHSAQNVRKRRAKSIRIPRGKYCEHVFSGESNRLPEECYNAETQIEQAIEQLPEIYRDPFLLADVERLSYAVVAEVLGQTIPVAKERIHKARLMVREFLKDCLVI
jgi:RNA polymerase sigma-70 factor, ECF subfamily